MDSNVQKLYFKVPSHFESKVNGVDFFNIIGPACLLATYKNVSYTSIYVLENDGIVEKQLPFPLIEGQAMSIKSQYPFLLFLYKEDQKDNSHHNILRVVNVENMSQKAKIACLNSL
eukprot:TRINITY_DN7921_c0_g1_i2.p1 TRINITY_DN7921_c0_g1~~TRINITY_DN7921_c0_g1_i2.p1  ORF type:complete len:116 (-),score=20.74 TRINITY_DN7921_c0_g1_i2:97-444(-)